MNIIINKNIPEGLITISIRKFKTTYTLKGIEYDGMRDLMLSIEKPLADRMLMENAILKIERDAILSRYCVAIEPDTVDDLICSLSGLGVESKSITIPCDCGDCDEVAIEDLDHYLPISEIAAEAEYACDFENGLCPSCAVNQQIEDAAEQIELAREE